MAGTWQSKMLVLAMALAFAPVVLAGDFVYELRNFPADAQSCPVHAEELQTRFTQMTGRTAFSAACERDFDNILKVVIHYSADARVQYVSTASPDFFSGRGLGTYATAEACAVGLRTESPTFTEQTGYDVFVAYCYQEPFARDRGWVARIDGLGQGPRKSNVYSDSVSVFGPLVNMDQAAVEARAREAFATQGAVLRSTVLRQRAVEAEITLTYYHAQALRIRQQTLAASPTGEDCAAEATYAEQVMRDAGIPSIFLLCSHRYTTGHYELGLVGFGESGWRVYPTTDRWASRAECVDDRAAVVERLRGAGRVNVVTAFCDFKEGQWQPLVFERN